MKVEIKLNNGGFQARMCVRNCPLGPAERLRWEKRCVMAPMDSRLLSLVATVLFEMQAGVRAHRGCSKSVHLIWWLVE